MSGLKLEKPKPNQKDLLQKMVERRAVQRATKMLCDRAMKGDWTQHDASSFASNPLDDGVKTLNFKTMSSSFNKDIRLASI